MNDKESSLQALREWAQRHNIKELDHDVQHLVKLRTLEIRSYDITELPESIGNLENLKKLTLMGIDISLVPNSIANLYNLRYLEIGGTYSYEKRELPLSICKLSKLKVLILKEHTLVKLPPEIGNLTQLVTLVTSSLNCFGRNEYNFFPPEIKKLKNLKTLCCNVGHIQEELCHLTSLKYFGYGGYELEELPKSIDNILALGYIKIRNLERFETIKTLYNKNLLLNGFEIQRSYKEYDQEIKNMKVTTHRYGKESLVEYIPNERFNELYKDTVYGVIERMFKKSREVYGDMSEEEIEFEEYLQAKKIAANDSDYI